MGAGTNGSALREYFFGGITSGFGWRAFPAAHAVLVASTVRANCLPRVLMAMGLAGCLLRVLVHARRSMRLLRAFRSLRSGSFFSGVRFALPGGLLDRKSTRLNSSHLGISYAVFCLKK